MLVNLYFGDAGKRATETDPVGLRRAHIGPSGLVFSRQMLCAAGVILFGKLIIEIWECGSITKINLGDENASV